MTDQLNKVDLRQEQVCNLLLLFLVCPRTFVFKGRSMVWRKISEEEVLSVVKDPENREESIKGRINLYKRVERRYLKVTCKEFSEEIFIISVVDKGGNQ